jgi:hypothetical protein
MALMEKFSFPNSGLGTPISETPFPEPVSIKVVPTHVRGISARDRDRGTAGDGIVFRVCDGYGLIAGRNQGGFTPARVGNIVNYKRVNPAPRDTGLPWR